MCEALEVELGALEDSALSALVVELGARADRLETLRLEVLGEWDARAAWAADGAANGASWLAAQGNVARSQAGGFLHDARRLRTMAGTTTALAEGALAPAKARLMSRVLNERTREAFARDEQVLIDTISGLSVDEAAQVLRFWQQGADADGPDPRDRDANGVWLSQGFNGRWQLKGDLDVESGTVLNNVLAGFVERIRAERRRQGVELAGMGPRLRAEGLMDMVRRATAAAEGAEAARPLVWVIAGAEALASGTGVCELAGGGAISALTAQRLACDADIAQLLMDPHSNEFDLGRTQRRASGTQRRLLWLRDGGCTFPGCDRPPGWCEAHHIVFWEHDGPTDLVNLALLCSHHHHLCHEGGFRLQRVGDQLVFHRPDGSRLEAPPIAA
ncbi:MAG TPA: DUF222 domain-containing protein [Acidimicrobiales bacterium]